MHKFKIKLTISPLAVGAVAEFSNDRLKGEQRKMKEAVEEWPKCRFDGTKLKELEASFYLPSVKPEVCKEDAIVEVSYDFNDLDSEVTLLCSRHLLMLPARPDARLYRVRRITAESIWRMSKREEEALVLD